MIKNTMASSIGPIAEQSGVVITNCSLWWPVVWLWIKQLAFLKKDLAGAQGEQLAFTFDKNDTSMGQFAWPFGDGEGIINCWFLKNVWLFFKRYPPSFHMLLRSWIDTPSFAMLRFSRLQRAGPRPSTMLKSNGNSFWIHPIKVSVCLWTGTWAAKY